MYVSVIVRWRRADKNALLGCHIGVIKRILGGKRGNSVGKVNRALKKPPSLDMKIRDEGTNGKGRVHTREYRQGYDQKIVNVSVWRTRSDKSSVRQGEEANPIIMISHSYRLLSSTSPSRRGLSEGGVGRGTRIRQDTHRQRSPRRDAWLALRVDDEVRGYSMGTAARLALRD